MKCPHYNKEIGVILSNKGKSIEEEFKSLQEQLGIWRNKYNELVVQLRKITGDDEED